jgi:hypothetical protein
MLRESVVLEQDREAECITRAEKEMTVLHDRGMKLARALFLGVLAEVCGKAGQVEEGLRIVAEALTAVAENRKHVNAPELYRLEGELTLQQDKMKIGELKTKEAKGKGQKSQGPRPRVEVEQVAEECFRKAIAMAQGQQAKSWELRASTSLARLWQQQGKAKQAHKLLSKIYHWFTEGV